MTALQRQAEVLSDDELEAMPKLPASWGWARLSTVASLQGGLAKDGKRATEADVREVAYLRVANVQRGYFDLSEIKTIFASDAEVTALRLEPGDILFNEGGDRDKLGRGWVWNGEVANCIHQNHVFRARPNRKLVEPKFVSHWGNSFGKQWFIRTGKQTTNLASISLRTLREFPVPIPPLREQQRILAKIEELFSDLDAGVAALQRVKANLKRCRAAVLNAAVTGKLTAEWRKQNPPTESADELLARILEERQKKWEADQLRKFAEAGKTAPNGWREKYVEPHGPDIERAFKLPTEWCWAAASQVCERMENGNTPPHDKMRVGEGEIPFIKVYNLTFDGNLDFTIKPTFISRETHETQLRRSRVLPGDVLMNIVGPPLGKVSLVPTEHPEWNMNQAVVLFRTATGMFNRFLTICLLAQSVLEWITSQAKATAGQHNISVGMSRLLPVPIPPTAEQAEIAAEVERRLSVVSVIETEVEHGLKRAVRLRQAILKRAFEGKLVPQDPADEPASVMVDRVPSTGQKRAEKRRPVTARGRESCPQ